MNVLIVDTHVDGQYRKEIPTEAQLQAQLDALAVEINANGGELVAVTSAEVLSDQTHPSMGGPAPTEQRLLFFVNKK
jgi:hypothetical protein